MPDDIKSAREIALARAEAESREITAEDRMRWKYTPEGEKLGARIIAGEEKLEEELGKWEEAARKYIIQGTLSVLLTNITLPLGKTEKEHSQKALDAVMVLKKDKGRVAQIVEQIRNLFEHYETQGNTQKNHAIEQLKTEYAQKLRQAIEQQLGSSASGMVADVDNLPQFKEEKRRLISQFDSQYIKLLNEYKEELKQAG
ncbi:MAG: hypothetical protein PHT28_01110 [Dehalococcoidales bacterium]|nr:hypothetical protein [Dehalococcoidales bacterium]MDD4230217.1 hypothetical protein [Dehalococcoidales bacterium]MDD4465102.1 hypothetical protein [Dehalococcoidales bacterium]MDD5401845.1 hypothetical protein [Dehalococcoidales bacterium]